MRSRRDIRTPRVKAYRTPIISATSVHNIMDGFDVVQSVKQEDSNVIITGSIKGVIFKKAFDYNYNELSSVIVNNLGRA